MASEILVAVDNLFAVDIKSARRDLKTVLRTEFGCLASIASVILFLGAVFLAYYHIEIFIVSSLILIILIGMSLMARTVYRWVREEEEPEDDDV